MCYPTHVSGSLKETFVSSENPSQGSKAAMAVPVSCVPFTRITPLTKPRLRLSEKAVAPHVFWFGLGAEAGATFSQCHQVKDMKENQGKWVFKNSTPVVELLASHERHRWILGRTWSWRLAKEKLDCSISAHILNLLYIYTQAFLCLFLGTISSVKWHQKPKSLELSTCSAFDFRMINAVSLAEEGDLRGPIEGAVHSGLAGSWAVFTWSSFIETHGKYTCKRCGSGGKGTGATALDTGNGFEWFPAQPQVSFFRYWEKHSAQNMEVSLVDQAVFEVLHKPIVSYSKCSVTLYYVPGMSRSD